MRDGAESHLNYLCESDQRSDGPAKEYKYISKHSYLSESGSGEKCGRSSVMQGQTWLRLSSTCFYSHKSNVNE